MAIRDSMFVTVISAAMIASSAAGAAPNRPANASTESSPTESDSPSFGISQPVFLQPVLPAKMSVGSTSTFEPGGLSQPQAFIPVGAVTISDSDDIDVAPKGAKASREEPPPSRWSFLWRQMSIGNGTNQTARSTAASSNAPAASPTSANSPVARPLAGLLKQFIGTSQGNPTAGASPTRPDRAVRPASAVAQESKPSDRSGSPVKLAAANQTVDSSADGTKTTRATATWTANVPNGSPALQNEVRVAEQWLTEDATGSAWELWGQLRGTNNADAAVPAGVTDSSRAAGPPTRAAAQDTEPASVGQNDNAWAGLWRPMEMTNTAPQAPGSRAPASAANAPAKRPEAERVPSLMVPMFYMTQDGAPGRANLPAAAAEHPPENLGRSLEQRLGDTSLARQLTLSGNQELRSSPLSSAATPLRAESEAWEQTWTEPWLAMTNQLTMTNEPDRPTARTGDAIQVAFLQESPTTPGGGTPEPDKIDLPGDSDGQGDDENGGANGDTEKKDGTLAEAEKLGDEPEDNSLQFLRAQTVLLEPGETRFDIGLEYTLSEDDFPVLIPIENNMVRLDEVHFKGRELTVPMELRYGLLKRVQLFLQVPIGWSNTQVSFDDFDAFANDGGLGDVSWGTTVQFQDATKDCPYIIGTFSATAPSGGDPFTGASGVAPSAPSLGNGFWSVAANVTWIRVYDPVVVYYGLGARRYFEHRYVGLDIEPGPEYNYTLGVGFSVTDKITFSTQFFGTYAEEIKVDGDRIEGSNQEPMSLRIATTILKPKDRLVEPFVTFGLTDDAVAANFGITWTY